MSNAISVVYHDATSQTPWVILPATSKRFTAQGWIAKRGDRIVVQSSDYGLIPNWSQAKQSGPLTLETGNAAGIIILTVIECVYDYSLSDVGIICECLPY